MSLEDETKAKEAIKNTPDSASKTAKQKREEKKEAEKQDGAVYAEDSRMVGPNDPPEKAIISKPDTEDE